MFHARVDYNKRIQDSANLIPDKEPVFLLRAQDENTLPTLEVYLLMLQSLPNDAPVKLGVRRQIVRVRDWISTHGTKAPDCEIEEIEEL